MNTPKECELWTDGSDDYLILLICTSYATGDKNVVFHKVDYWKKRVFFYEKYGTHEIDASYLDFLIETPQSLEMSLFTEKFELLHEAPKEKHRGYHEVVGLNYKATIKMNAPKECEFWFDGSDDYLPLLISTNYATGAKTVVFHKLEDWQKRKVWNATHEVDASYLDFLIETPQSLEMSLFTEKFKLLLEKHPGYHEVVGWNYKARINYF